MIDNALSLQAQTALAQSKNIPDIAKTASFKQAKQVAQDFESFFLGQVLQPMFANTEAEEPFGGGPGEQIWRSMQVDEYGKAMAANGGVGVADAVLKELLKAQEEAQQ